MLFSCCSVMLSRALGEMEAGSGKDLIDVSSYDVGKRFLEQAACVMDLKKVVQSLLLMVRSNIGQTSNSSTLLLSIGQIVDSG